MTIAQAVNAGITGEKLSRTLTGTDEVCAARSAVAAGTGSAMGAASIGAVAFGASTFGVSALATVAAPVLLPVAIAAGAVSLIRSLFD